MLTRKEVAKRLGIKASTLNGVLNGTRMMGRNRAAEMEDKTGISCLKWLYHKYNLNKALEDYFGESINSGRGRT